MSSYYEGLNRLMRAYFDQPPVVCVETTGECEMSAIAGPWVAETRIHKDEDGAGLAVIAVIPEVHRMGCGTPTRGMVAWVSSGIGACETDDRAVATARLIASAPDLLAALGDLVEQWGALGLNNDPFWNAARAAIAKAEGGAP